MHGQATRFTTLQAGMARPTHGPTFFVMQKLIATTRKDIPRIARSYLEIGAHKNLGHVQGLNRVCSWPFVPRPEPRCSTCSQLLLLLVDTLPYSNNLHLSDGSHKASSRNVAAMYSSTSNNPARQPPEYSRQSTMHPFSQPFAGAGMTSSSILHSPKLTSRRLLQVA